jgi:hypothetical protein
MFLSSHVSFCFLHGPFYIQEAERKMPQCMPIKMLSDTDFTEKSTDGPRGMKRAK